MKITDYHRQIASLYLKKLIIRYGLEQTVKKQSILKNIFWTEKGLFLLEKHK
jgi:hypothetical protein